MGLGDTLRVEVLGGDRRALDLPVVRLIYEFVGAGGCMNRRALNRRLGEGDVVTSASLTTRDVAAAGAALDARPGVIRWTDVASTRRSIEETAGKNLTTFTLILSAFAVAVAFGVLYNTARLSLAERSRDLASLRVLGFRTSEVAYLFFGELALLTLVAIPIGLVVGRAFCVWYVDVLQNDVFRIPLVLSRTSYTMAAALILVAVLSLGARRGPHARAARPHRGPQDPRVVPSRAVPLRPMSRTRSASGFWPPSPSWRPSAGRSPPSRCPSTRRA